MTNLQVNYPSLMVLMTPRAMSEVKEPFCPVKYEPQNVPVYLFEKTINQHLLEYK